jgi:hypothetical protein
MHVFAVHRLCVVSIKHRDECVCWIAQIQCRSQNERQMTPLLFHVCGAHDLSVSMVINFLFRDFDFFFVLNLHYISHRCSYIIVNIFRCPEILCFICSKRIVLYPSSNNRYFFQIGFFPYFQSIPTLSHISNLLAFNKG